ncbi:MAG: hypothetical protein K6A69_04730 [Lachnospiraceae bacterium]|nr:hypothetical protein [Lachnospiraceae bacterium]
MQKDFHYYATYAAAFLAGYDHEDSLRIAYCAQFVDECSASLLRKLKAPRIAATTQLQLELMDANSDILSLQDITRIWASFHFLPRDLYAVRGGCTRHYRSKFRLICGPNGDMIKRTVELSRNKGAEATGIAMHVLADTWAHANFAGTPSLAINNTDYHFYEIFPDGSEKLIRFNHNPISKDDLEKSAYTNSLYQSNENSIMNLGHGRAGHLPDYSFCKFKYLPAWGGYKELVKDNPSDYNHAFRQMVYAMRYLRGEEKSFYVGIYDKTAVQDHEEEIDSIIRKRRTDAEADWKAFGEKLSGREIPDYDINAFQQEYMDAAEEEKDNTVLGRFINAAIAQKSMVTSCIYRSKNMLAGYTIDPRPTEQIKAFLKSAKIGGEDL